MKIKEILPLIDSPYLEIRDFSKSHRFTTDCCYRMSHEEDVNEILKNHGEKYVHIINGYKDTVKLIVLDTPFEAE